MEKKYINGFSPGLNKYSRPHGRRSIKENIECRAVGRSNTLHAGNRVLQVMHVNEMNFGKVEESTSKANFKLLESVKKESLIDSLEKVRDQIRDIRTEGRMFQAEVMKFREKIGQNLSSREGSLRFKHGNGDFDEISKISDTQKEVLNEVAEIKIQLNNLQKRLNQGEEMIRSKALDNYSLHMEAINLNIKLRKLKTERSTVNAKCKMCGVF